MSDRYREDLDRAVSFSGRSHEFFARAKAEELLRLARRNLGNPAALDALDAGCGIGLVDRHLTGQLATLTGTDVSAEALEAGTRENPGVRYELAKPERLPFDDGTFDLTFAISVLHVLDPAARPAFVAELARVTREGGLVAIFEHNPYNPLTRLTVRRFVSPVPIRMLPLRQAKRLLRAAGTDPVECGFMLLSPSRRAAPVAVERGVRRLPLGAQYYVASRVPAV